MVHDMPPRDRDIAMVFQDYALYPHMMDQMHQMRPDAAGEVV